MERIGGKEELAASLEGCDGCVIYGAGLVASCLIQHIIKEQMAAKVVCIAVKSKEKNPSAVMGIPVYELNDLAAYRETYLFLIGTLEHLQDTIKKELVVFGCSKIQAITNSYYTAIREELNSFSPDIFCMLQKGLCNMYENFVFLDKKIDQMRKELTCIIEEQNEVSFVNTNAFAEYQNCYRGKEIVIVATGPTLNNYKPIQGAIHIGVNTAYKNPNISLDYLFVQDGRPSYLKAGKYTGLENVSCKIFMGRVLKRSPFEYSEFPEKYRMHENVRDFIIDHSWPEERIYRDICHHPVSGGITVTFSALHFALFTYPKKIYLVGCDSMAAPHFDGTTDGECPIDERAAEAMQKRYLLTKEFAQIHYPEIEIISVNPVGLKGIFKDIYTT